MFLSGCFSLSVWVSCFFFRWFFFFFVCVLDYFYVVFFFFGGIIIIIFFIFYYLNIEYLMSCHLLLNLLHELANMILCEALPSII